MFTKLLLCCAFVDKNKLPFSMIDFIIHFTDISLSSLETRFPSTANREQIGFYSRKRLHKNPLQSSRLYIAKVRIFLSFR